MTKDMLTMVVLKPDDGHETRLVDVRDLGAFQKAVGGYIEVVPYLTLFAWDGTTHKCIALCDEEGKLKGKPVNEAATALWNRQLAEIGVKKNPDVLVGDIAFLFGDPDVMARF